MNGPFRIRAILATLLVVCAVAPAATTADFRQMQLAYGIDVDIPSHWHIISAQSRKNLALMSESMLNATGLEGDADTTDALLAVNATPAPTGAMIRVSYAHAADITEADIESMTRTDFEYLRRLMVQNMKRMEAHGGPHILDVAMPRMVTIDGRSSLLIPYRRSSPVDGRPWQVMMYQVPDGSATVRFTLSYREHDQAIWKPIIEHVRQSFSL